MLPDSKSHTPVLLNEVLEIFDPKPGQIYIDATVDGGGHARAIAQRAGPTGRVLGIDWDCDLIRESGIRNQESGIKNIELVCENYANIKVVADGHRICGKVNGVLFDLGFSSYHIEKSGRGFSFAKDEPLDMRYNPAENKLTAEEIVNRWPEQALADILSRWGEERYAGRIARAIVRKRSHKRIGTASALAEVIYRSVPRMYRNARLDPATRTFQALRIAVNNELDSLAAVLPQALELLADGGKLIAISFHSLEDRIVKKFMRDVTIKGLVEPAIVRPLRPTRAEVMANPRAASARLRWLIKL